MTRPPLDPELVERLRAFDTPTVCNALEVVMPERRGFGFTTGAMVCAAPALAPVCGYARTATFRAASPSALSAAEQRALRGRYYEYVGAGPGPSVAVIQDLDPEPGFGAFWGEVNSNVHKALGALGAVTNGSIRDLDALAPGFQLLARKLGPSHGFGHIVDFAGAVNIYGMVVHDGDLVHADRHGAVVIPHEAAARIAEAVDLVARREKLILDACAAPGFDVARLKRAMADATEIH